MSSGAISGNIQRKAPPWQESSKGPATRGCGKACAKACSRECAKVASRGSGRSWNDCCGGDSVSYRQTVAERLRQASASDLEAWAENVLDAETIDDVFDSSS